MSFIPIIIGFVLGEEEKLIQFIVMDGARVRTDGLYIRGRELAFKEWSKWIQREYQGIREYTATVGQNGRIVIPKKIMEALGIRQGDTVLATVKFLLRN